MKRGEVWTTSIPSTGGHEQHGTRPVIIVADTSAPLAIAIPCTSNARALRFPYTVEIQPSKTNGLTQPTIALGFQLRALDKKRLIEQVGVLESEHLDPLMDSLRTMLQL